MSLWRRLKYLLPSFRRAEDRDMQEELESLRAMAGPAELGNLTLAAENARAVWGWNWLGGLRQDLRYSRRTLIRHPSVTIIAMISIAIGIGANTMIFSLVNALLFAPVPYPEPERLAMISGLTRSDCVGLRDRTNLFQHFGCYVDPISGSLAGNRSATEPPERVRGQLFTAGMARALGVTPLIGRWFTDAEERQGADSVILIRESLWQASFGGGDVIGKTVQIDGEVATIIGVVPEEFEFLDPTVRYWSPLRHLEYGSETSAPMFGGLARLQRGVDVRTVQAEMDVLAKRVDETPRGNPPRRIHVEALDGFLSERYRDSALTLQGIVTFVLLIACANVAGLLLAQGVSQRRELAVRVALGSGRWRILRQLLMHSLVLSCVSGVLGLAIGWWGIQSLQKVVPAGLPRTVYETPLNANVLLFTFSIVVLFGILSGIVPAIQLSRARPNEMLQQFSRNTTAGTGHQRLRSAFVALQIALAFVLLVGAGLMINSLMRMMNEDVGFSPDNLIAVQVHLPENKFRRSTNIVTGMGAVAMEIDPVIRIRTEQMRQNFEAIGGAVSASAIAMYPPLSGTMNMPVRIEGGDQQEQQRPQFLPVMSDYFRTLQVPVVRGREFTRQDSAGNVPVAVINEAMADFFWPNQNPVGKHVQIISPLLPNEPAREVVGVVREVKQYLGQVARPQLYVPYNQLALVHDERLTEHLRELTFVIRTPATVAQMTDAVQDAVGRADSTQAISKLQTMRQTVFGTMPRRQVYAGLVTTFGVIAVLLAMVGVYGVIAQIVNQRTNEIGIRMALGADASQVRRLVIRKGLRLITIGLIAGTAGAVMVTRVIRTSLFGISPTDPFTFGVTLVILGGVALTACYLPTRRASRIDPALALRHD